MKNAVGALQSILAARFLPSALELADEFTLAAAAEYTKNNRLGVCRAHLIVELDGQKNSVRDELPAIERVIRKHKPLFLERGYGNTECEKIWQIRREFSAALRVTGLTKLNEDIVVPRGKLEELFKFTAKLQRKHALPVACFGHAGDGNIHVNVMVDETQPGARKRCDAILDELFARILTWNGAITGEHGIGLAKKRWWPLAVSEEVRELHRLVKNTLDPKGILNPGKFV
jgi:glycolate oxidase